ncbi:multidrug efflux SMR transporter [Candidatus Albibeggiatoa sp. nov. NOAA]|uniref:DMT family transporter n=1 Tax=Candidatus Albibeggiatoa sp. nov. NOAA TaxID=3162724 RepID=UPI003301A0AD|nr:multidrug efflux SMR transporter [Thiotrichaceae bacterium]
MGTAYIYLLVAIVMDVTATSALKASNEFTRVMPTLIVLIGFVGSNYLLALVLRTFPIGVTYAVWSGLGIVLVTAVGFIFYKQVPDIAALIGMLFIVVGVVVINLFSKMAG